MAKEDTGIFKDSRRTFLLPTKISSEEVDKVRASSGGELINLDDLVGSDANAFNQNLLEEKLEFNNQVNLNIDYSSFASHSFFSDAQQSLIVAINKILTEFPTTGSVSQLDSFYDSLTGYEKFVFNNWPKVQKELTYAEGGYGAMAPSYGDNGGVLNTPNSSAMSVEFWIKPIGITTTGSALVVGKQGPISTTNSNLRGWSVWLSCSAASATDSATGLATPDDFTLIYQLQDGTGRQNGPSGSLGTINRNEYTHVAITYDGASKVKSYKGGVFETSFVSSSLANARYDSPAQFAVCSGGMSLRGNRLDPGGYPIVTETNTAKISASIDELRIWDTERTHTEITRFYNQQVFADSGSLVGYWKFNNLFPTPTTDLDFDLQAKNTVLDASGYGNHLTNYNFTHSDGVAFYDATKKDTLEGTDILKYYDLNLMSGSQISNQTQFISVQYASASLHDNQNPARLSRFIPAFFLEQDNDPFQGGIGLLTSFLHILAKELDVYKIFIDQFPNILSSNYSRFDKTPTAFLPIVAENFGFPLKTILNSSTPAEWLGELRQEGSQATSKKDLETINNIFWQRILNNLSYIYKKKGTREALDAMLRIYGVPLDIFRILELGGTASPPKNDKTSEIRNVREHMIRPSGSNGTAGVIRAISGPGSSGPAAQTALNIGATTNFGNPHTITGPGSAKTTIESRFRLSSSIDHTYHTIWEMIATSSLQADGNTRDATANSASYMTLFLDTTNISNYPPTCSLVWAATRSQADNAETRALAETPVSLSLRIAPFSHGLAYNTAATIQSGSDGTVKYELFVRRSDSDYIDNSTIAYGSSSQAKSNSTAHQNGYRATIQYATPPTWSMGSGSFFNRHASPGESFAYLSSLNDTTFQGSISNFRIWNRILKDEEIDHHTLNYRSLATDDGIGTYDDIKVAYGFDENIASDANAQIVVLDASTNGVNATASGFTAGTVPYNTFDTEILSLFPFFDDGDLGIENIRTFEMPSDQSWLALTGSAFGLDPNQKFGIAFEANLTDELRRDQADLLFNFKTLNAILGTHPGKMESEDTYESLENLRKLYFNKRWARNKTLLLNEYNIAMKYLALNIDHVFRLLCPVRADYVGSFFAVEPHILERKRNPHKQPNEFLTPPMRSGNIISASFTDLANLNQNDLPRELLAMSNHYDTIVNLPTQDEYLRDMVAAHDRLANFVNLKKQINLDVDLGAIRKTKVRQGRDTSPRIAKRYLQPMNPFNTNVADGKTYNQTNLEFNSTTPPANNLDDMWDEPDILI